METSIYSFLGERGSKNPPGTRRQGGRGGRRCIGVWGTAPGCLKEVGGWLTHAVRGAGAGGPAPSGTRSRRPGSSRQAQLWLRPGPPARPRCQTSFGRVGVPGPPGAGGKGPARRRGSVARRPPSAHRPGPDHCGSEPDWPPEPLPVKSGTAPSPSLESSPLRVPRVAALWPLGAFPPFLAAEVGTGGLSSACELPHAQDHDQGYAEVWVRVFALASPPGPGGGLPT